MTIVIGPTFHDLGRKKKAETKQKTKKMAKKKCEVTDVKIMLCEDDITTQKKVETFSSHSTLIYSIIKQQQWPQ
jgi:hypothetical protein